MANAWIESQGRNAWKQHGVTGQVKNPHPRNTEHWVDWLNGFSDAKGAEHLAAINEAADYHALSMRDNTKDREWAERLSARSV